MYAKIFFQIQYLNLVAAVVELLTILNNTPNPFNVIDLRQRTKPGGIKARDINAIACLLTFTMAPDYPSNMLFKW